MTAFVILHYRAIDMTKTCVERIEALEGNSHIVIVDNASPNGTGRLLAEEYAKKPLYNSTSGIRAFMKGSRIAKSTS